MPPNELSKAFRSFTYSKDTFLRQTSNLLVESPLEIVINSEKHILIMFTPEMTKELVIGFIFTDGLVSDIAEIEELIPGHEFAIADLLEGVSAIVSFI